MKKYLSKNLVISFSGGKTPALMAILLHTAYKDKYNLLTVFANTGRENEETLQFVNNCDNHFNLNVNWIEAVINPKKGIGTEAIETNFIKADRNGYSFSAMIVFIGKSIYHKNRVQ